MFVVPIAVPVLPGFQTGVTKITAPFRVNESTNNPLAPYLHHTATNTAGYLYGTTTYMKADRPALPRTAPLPNYATGLLAALLLLTIAACNDSPETPGGKPAKKTLVGDRHQLFETAQFSAVLKQSLQAPAAETGKAARTYDPARDLRDAYNRAAFVPLWVQEEGLTNFAESLLSDLDSLTADGLNPAAYGLQNLRRQADALKQAKSANLPAALAFDTACTRAYLLAARHLLMGSVPTSLADADWHNANDSAWDGPQRAAAQAADTGRYTGLAAYRSQWPAYVLLRKEMDSQRALAKDQTQAATMTAMASQSNPADSLLLAFARKELPGFAPESVDTLTAGQQVIRAYQWRNGLAATGKLDSATTRLLAQPRDTLMQRLAANLERLRWLPRLPDERYVVANIPQMEVFFRDRGKITFHMRTVVGKPSRPTPSLSADMKNVVFNPSWGVPPTILKNDVLPGVARRGGAYLRRKGLTAYDRRGRPVAASSINAKNVRGLSFRQPPGAHNALGDIKFNLPNRWDIYLHDTPHREDFPRRQRALSSGCVRVARPKDFAEFILSTLEGRDFSRPVIDSLVNTRRTMFEELKTPIPVHIVYLTAFEDSTGSYVRYLPDVYKKDAKVMALVQ